MKKFITVCAALLIGASALFAQSPYDHEGQWNISVTGGGLFTVGENYFSYNEHGRFWDQLNCQGAFSVGYDFSRYFGARLWAGYGKNVGAMNARQTLIGEGRGFFPYSFKSVNTFADAILSITGLAEEVSPLSVKFYGGIGLGYSWDMTVSKRNMVYPQFHPLLTPTEHNVAFGFRLGSLIEYTFTEHFGLVADLNAEAYVDDFNGVNPSNNEIDQREGYAGFPLDLRAYAGFGVVYHF